MGLMGVGKKRVNCIKRRYADMERVPEHGRPGKRKRGLCGAACAVLGTHAGHRCDAMRLEGILTAQVMHILHNTIHAILERRGLARRNRTWQRKSFARYERTFSNAMWHGDWKQLKDGMCLIAFEDDALRLITGHGAFDYAVSTNAVLALYRMIAEHGKSFSIITDRGSRPCAVDAESRRRRVR